MGVAPLLQSDDATISVLLVESDARQASFTERFLGKHGCRVVCVHDCASARDALRESFDMVLLDPALPDGDGLRLCREIREFSTVPIIVLNANGQTWDCVRALEEGADDYVAQPFAPPELLARVRARVRRRRGQVGAGSGRLELGPLRLSLAHRLAWMNDRAVDLTACEFRLLWSLAVRAGTPLERELLVQDTDISARTVDVHMSRIRAKLAKAAAGGEPPRIRSVRGVGYVLAHPSGLES